MPQYKIRIRNLDTGLIDHVSVWTSDKRSAGLEAVAKAKQLFKTDNIELA
jgi:hypothetical protein